MGGSPLQKFNITRTTNSVCGQLDMRYLPYSISAAFFLLGKEKQKHPHPVDVGLWMVEVTYFQPQLNIIVIV